MLLTRQKLLQKHSSSHWFPEEFRRPHQVRIGAGLIPRGSTTGIFTARFKERTEERTVFGNRILFLNNYNKRNLWKMEDAHHAHHKKFYSKRQQKFGIKTKQIQRREYFPTTFMFPIHPEPTDHKKLNNELFLNYKRDPTVRNSHPKNYIKFIVSEELTKYEMVEYLKEIYKIDDILSIDVEKVDEQNLNTNAFGWSPFRTTERSPIMALSQNDDIAYNDRIKIAHVFTDGEFEFPDLMKVFKKDLEFEKADRVMTAITEHLDNMVLEDGKLSVKDFTHLKEKYGPLITQLNTKIADYNNKKIEKELQTTKQILEKWPKHEKITNLVRHELEMKNNTEGQMSLNYQRLRNLDDFPFFAVMHAEYAFNFLKLMMNGHSKNFNYKFFERYEPTDKLIPIPEIRNKDEYFFLRRIGPRLQKWLGDKEEVKKSKAQATDFNKLIRDPKKISKQILDISPKSQKEKDDEATKTDSDVLRQLDMPDKYKNFKGINLQLYTGTHKAIEDGLVELAKDPTKDIKDLVGNVRQAAVEEVKLFDKERLMRRRRLKHKEMETGKSLKEREEEDEIKREYLKKYQDWSKEKAIAESKLKVDEKYRREVRPFGRE